MHIRPARCLPAAVAVAATATGTLAWAPAATAQASEPTTFASAAPTETPEPEEGSVSIVKKDPAGDALPGAAFLLLDATGREAGTGKTDAQGKLIFTDLAPGVYRLKETSSGSPLHDVVADQDVIVIPGGTARLTIVDPFKPARVLLKTKDDKTGKFLPGATVNIGSGDKTLLTLTTGPKGTASGELPVSSRRTEFWVKQAKAPAGYDLYKPPKTFTAGPGAPVTVTVTNSKTSITPNPGPTERSTDKSTNTPSMPADKPTDGTSGGSKPIPTDSTMPDTGSSPVPHTGATDEATPKASAGSLAHTGVDATPWILGAAGLLVAGGIGAVVAARNRRTDDAKNQSGEG